MQVNTVKIIQAKIISHYELNSNIFVALLKIIDQSQMRSQLLYLYLCLNVIVFQNGAFVACVGPLIPLFALKTGHAETSYSYLFVVLTSANIMGCFVAKWIVDRFNLRQVFNGMTLLAIAGLLVLSSNWSDATLSVGFLIVNTANMVNNITLTSVIFKHFTDEKPALLMMIAGFIFGLGTILGPGIVILFQGYFFNLVNLFNVAILIALHFAVLPERNSESKDQVLGKSKLSRKIQLLICGLFCVYMVQELGLASWMPTYAIKMEVAQTHTAGTYSFLFWIVNCFSRLIWIWAPGSISTQIKISLLLSISSTFLCLLLHVQQYYWLVCIFAPISAGFILANLYSLYMSLPHDNGIKCTPQNTANFVLGTTFGEGIFITSIGYGMEYIGPQFLFIIELAFAIIAFVLFKQTLSSFGSDKNVKKTSVQCELLQISH